MPEFAWHAVDPSGIRVRSRAVAHDAAILQRILEARGLMVLDVRPRPSSPLARKHGRGDSLEFLRALSAMVGSGVPIADAIGMAGELARAESAPVICAIEADVRSGSGLAAALSAHDTWFNGMSVGLIRAGEESGQLAASLDSVVQDLEREAEFRARLFSASIYPLVLLLAGAMTVSVLVLFVLPRFAELIYSSGEDLPAATRLLMSMHEFISGNRLVLGVIFVTVVAGTAAAARTAAGARALSHLLFRTPVVGTVRRCVLGARFARSLGMLIHGGTPIVAAVNIAGAGMADPVVRDDIALLRTTLTSGETLSSGIGRARFLTRVAIQLIAIGERAGDLPRHLIRTADVLEAEARRTLERLLSLAEPAMILVFGAIVGFVAIALLQAIYGLNAGAFR